MKYDISHTNPMTWDEFHIIVKKLIDDLKTYEFDAITPILRSGAIPATMIANKLQIISTIPIQVKYNYEQNIIETVQLPKCPENKSKDDIRNILVTDCNTYSGGSARKVLEILKADFPNAKIHYACVTKVYGGPKKIDGYESYHVGQWTNEAFKENAPEYCREGITIYPWETAEYELQDINNDF